MTLSLLVTALLPSSRASADDRPPKDYGYVFPDDPLAAGFFGPNDAHIRVLPTPKRSTLIRPRTQFVDEMLKSVEAL